VKRDIFYRSPGNYDVTEASDEAGVATVGESMTVQAMAEDADLNVLMRRFGITGKFPENVRVPSYGDFSHITDYRSAIDAVRAADVLFMEYPAEFRARFDNNPQILLEFAANNGKAFQEMVDAFPRSGISGSPPRVDARASGGGAAADAGPAAGGAPAVGGGAGAGA
jgi:hypothetical protein